MSEDIPWKEKPFDPSPRFYNHMIHWGPWAKHFESDGGDLGTLALMLGEACDEIDRLRKVANKYHKAQAELLFAFIGVVETGKPKPFGESYEGPWASIQTLNRWRKENKLNIKQVDVS